MGWERVVVFWVILVVGIATAIAELILIFDLVRNPNSVDTAKAILAIVAASDPAICFAQVRQLWSKYYLEKEFLTEDDLYELMDRRLGTLSLCNGLLQASSSETVIKELVRSHLRFLENILKEAVGPYSYEISIFINSDHPLIYAYHDSGGQTIPRSYAAREQNPNYYREKKYEVVELLDKPSPEVIVISNTRSPEVNYSFASREQLQRVRSTLLYCFDARTPAALVVVCDIDGAFSRRNERLKKLTCSVGLGISSEMELARKLG